VKEIHYILTDICWWIIFWRCSTNSKSLASVHPQTVTPGLTFRLLLCTLHFKKSAVPN